MHRPTGSCCCTPMQASPMRLPPLPRSARRSRCPGGVSAWRAPRSAACPWERLPGARSWWARSPSACRSGPRPGTRRNWRPCLSGRGGAASAWAPSRRGRAGLPAPAPAGRHRGRPHRDRRQHAGAGAVPGRRLLRLRHRAHGDPRARGLSGQGAHVVPHAPARRARTSYRNAEDGLRRATASISISVSREASDATPTPVSAGRTAAKCRVITGMTSAIASASSPRT